MTYATASCGLEAAPALCALAVRALAEGHAIHATARMSQSDQDTVGAWLTRAARQSRLVRWSHWQHRHGTACPWEALWRFVPTPEHHRLTAKRLWDSEGETGVWRACAPAWRLVVAFVGGKRTQENASRRLQRVVAVTAAPIPCGTSDPGPAYEEARLAASGQGVQPERQGHRGRHPAPRRMPRPHLWSAQVVKHRAKGRVVEVTHTVVFGEAPQIEALLAAAATRMTIHTSVVEREPLSWRAHHRRLTRTTLAFSHALPWLEKPWWLCVASSHFC